MIRFFSNAFVSILLYIFMFWFINVILYTRVVFRPHTNELFQPMRSRIWQPIDNYFTRWYLYTYTIKTFCLPQQTVFRVLKLWHGEPHDRFDSRALLWCFKITGVMDVYNMIIILYKQTIRSQWFQFKYFNNNGITMDYGFKKKQKQDIYDLFNYIWQVW